MPIRSSITILEDAVAMEALSRQTAHHNVSSIRRREADRLLNDAIEMERREAQETTRVRRVVEVPPDPYALLMALSRR